MFSLKPCTTYLHIIIHATDIINKNENVLCVLRTKKNQEHRIIVIRSDLSRAWARRWPGDVDGYAGRSRLRYYNKLFIITTRIIILCARTIRQIFSVLFLFSKNCSIIIYYYYWDLSGRLTDRKNGRLQFSAPECRVNGGKWE